MAIYGFQDAFLMSRRQGSNPCIATNVGNMSSKGLRSDALSTDAELDASYNVAINH